MKLVLKALAEKQKPILVTFKVSKAEQEKMRENAEKWAAGNLSEWIRYAAMELEPKTEHLVEK